MEEDEQAIRELVDTWMEATGRGDMTTALDLLTDDAIFMAPGKEPFGKQAWAQEMKDLRIEGSSEICELQVLGNWAWMRTHIEMTMTPVTGDRPTRMEGYALTILQKGADGRWRIARDANLPATA